jgi:leucyl/phenylalanyl-tRNA--protein transferase
MASRTDPNLRFRFGGRRVFKPEEADDRGLLAVGGSLTTDLLIEAYSSGAFPWSSDPVVSWWSPDPRAIFDLETFKSHRSVQKRVRQSGWTFTVNRSFAVVMAACAEATKDRPETWISSDFVASYNKLHQLGVAHSVEVWEGAELVGGLYGVQLGGFFGGESMFHRKSDASKAAVAYLVERCRASGLTLLDAQVPTPHLSSIGAVEISRVEYLDRLERALVVEARPLFSSSENQ